MLVRLHRYAGRGLAGFLIFEGLTGSAIAFNEELNALLNPALFRSPSRGASIAPAILAARVETALAGAQVTYIALGGESGERAVLRVESKTDTELPFVQVFADPVTGEVPATREGGACCLAPVHLMPFLHLAHYSLQIPGAWGIFLMGIMGMLWAADCFVGLAGTCRARARYGKNGIAWCVKRHAGAFYFNLDLHRAGGLWLWIVLRTVATSGVALNRPEQVFRPVVSMFSQLTPSLNEIAAQRYQAHPLPARLSYDEAIVSARREAARRGLRITPIYAFQYPRYAASGIAFATEGASGKTGLGPFFYYFDVGTGDLVVLEIVAMLSITGLVIWWRKGYARRTRVLGPRRIPV